MSRVAEVDVGMAEIVQAQHAPGGMLRIGFHRRAVVRRLDVARGPDREESRCSDQSCDDDDGDVVPVRPGCRHGDNAEHDADTARYGENGPGRQRGDEDVASQEGAGQRAERAERRQLTDDTARLAQVLQPVLDRGGSDHRQDRDGREG